MTAPAPRHLIVLAWLLVPGAALAQSLPADTLGRDTLRLGALHRDAIQRDPRAAQLLLLDRQATLRLRSLDAERLPTLGLNAQGQYQSDVPAIPFTLPGGATPPPPPHDSYDAHVVARQRLWDPTLAPRREIERARLLESQSRVRVSLFALRQAVNDAYFGALLLQSQHAEAETGLTDLEAQLAVARDRVRLGAALPGEAAAIEAELLRRRQSLAELAANRQAALEVLGDLTGRTISDATSLSPPALAALAPITRAVDSAAVLRIRPEFEQLARSRELLERQEALAGARDRPRVSAFGRAGYGRPGLNPLGRDFDSYWLAGVLLEWSPWTWGTTQRERETLALQRRIVDTEEAALAAGIARGIVRDVAAAGRLERTLATDDTIVALRERILRETRLRFGEGVVTAAEYVDRQTDLLAARLARATHRVELAQARARVLTALGVEIP